jgi:hypothetical protein
MKYNVIWSELATDTYLSILEEVQLFSHRDAERLDEEALPFHSLERQGFPLSKTFLHISDAQST